MPTQATYPGADSLEQSQLKDTVYGIENEALIPIRHTEITPKTEQTNNVLFDPSPIKNGTENWQVLILLTAVLLVGLVKAFSNNRYRFGLKALINYSVAQEITREEQVFFHRSNVFLSITYMLTLSLFLFQIKTEILNPGEQVRVNSFFVILGAITMLYLVKYLFSKLLLFIFNDNTTASEYIFNVSLYNNLLGIFLIPILCIDYFTELPFNHLLVYIVIPIGILVFFFRLIRLVAIGRSIGLLYVYIFLYICSLEILPLVVLYRIFI